MNPLSVQEFEILKSLLAHVARGETLSDEQALMLQGLQARHAATSTPPPPPPPPPQDGVVDGVEAQQGPALVEVLDTAVTRLQQSVLASDAADTDHARSRAALDMAQKAAETKSVGAKQARHEGREACDELVNVLGRLRQARFSE